MKGPKPRRQRSTRPEPRYRGLRRFFHRRHLVRRFFRLKYWWLWLFVVGPLVMMLGVFVTLVVAYGIAAILTWRLFARHEPSGDVGARTFAVPDSRG